MLTVSIPAGVPRVVGESGNFYFGETGHFYLGTAQEGPIRKRVLCQMPANLKHAGWVSPHSAAGAFSGGRPNRGPIHAIIEYLEKNASSDDIVVTTYGDSLSQLPKLEYPWENIPELGSHLSESPRRQNGWQNWPVDIHRKLPDEAPPAAPSRPEVSYLVPFSKQVDSTSEPRQVSLPCFLHTNNDQGRRVPLLLPRRHILNID